MMILRNPGAPEPAAELDRTRWSTLLPDVVVLAGEESGWRGRSRTFNPLIQSLLPESGLASRVLSVWRASVGRRIGVSQMPIPK